MAANSVLDQAKPCETATLKDVMDYLGFKIAPKNQACLSCNNLYAENAKLKNQNEHMQRLMIQIAEILPKDIFDVMQAQAHGHPGVTSFHASTNDAGVSNMESVSGDAPAGNNNIEFFVAASTSGGDAEAQSNVKSVSPVSTSGGDAEAQRNMRAALAQQQRGNFQTACDDMESMSSASSSGGDAQDARINMESMSLASSSGRVVQDTRNNLKSVVVASREGPQADQEKSSTRRSLRLRKRNTKYFDEQLSTDNPSNNKTRTTATDMTSAIPPRKKRIRKPRSNDLLVDTRLGKIVLDPDVKIKIEPIQLL